MSAEPRGGRLGVLGLLLALAAGGSGCTFMQRSLSWPTLDPLLDEDWYCPCDPVPGDPQAAPLKGSAGGPVIPRPTLERMADYARRNDSCALLVLHRGRLALERYWCGLDRAHRVNAWSMAKTVTALVVGAALERGWLRSLDQTLDTWLPEWAGDARGRITLRQLLQMSSGLGIGNMIRIHIGSQARRAVLDTPLARPPGEAFRYSNVNSLLLGMVLERATGRRYAELLDALIWRPLGAGPARVWLDRPGGTAKTYCCLLATARDWARVGLLLVRQGRVAGRQVVGRRWVEHMLRPSPLEQNYGLHVWLGYTRPPERFGDWSEPFATADTFMLVGRDEQRVYGVPAHDLVIVRIGHQAEHWDDPRLPNLAVAALRRHDPRLSPFPHSKIKSRQ